jgi:hypothetical protein
MRAAVELSSFIEDEMKKLFLAILISVFGITALGTLPADCSVVYAQKKDKGDKKKDPPGPPVVREKPKEKKDDKPKDDKPKRGKKPDEL